MKEERARSSFWSLKLMLAGFSLAAVAAVGLGQSPPPAPAAAKPPGPSGPPTVNPAPPAADQPVAPPESAAAKTPPGTVVMKVGDQQVTAGQIQSVLKSLPVAVQRTTAAQGLKVVGDQYSLLLLLSQQAVANGLDQSPDFKQKMELQRLTWLAQDEYKKVGDNVHVSPDETKQYYDQHQKDFEQVEVRQVSVRKKVSSVRGDSPGLPEAEAKKRAEDIRQALASGQDAAKVAEQYKLANVVFFPDARPVRHGQLPGEVDKTAWTLKDGECSEIQDNPMNFYFVQVVKHDQPPLQDVSKEIEGKIKEEKFNKAVDDLKQNAKIWLDPAYFAPAPGAKVDADAAPAAKPPAQSPKAETPKPQ